MNSRFLLPLLMLFFLLVSYQGNLKGQSRHPGPRLTCPICNAYMIKAAMNPTKFKSLPKASKIEYVKTRAPGANPQEVVAIIDQFDKVDLRKVVMDNDVTFRSYVVDFGDGKTSSFYTIRSTSSDWKISGNNVSELLDKISGKDVQKQSVYFLVDDMYDSRSSRFLENVELYNEKNQSYKFKGVGCDVIVGQSGQVKRLGSTILEPGAKLKNVSPIVTIESKGIKSYKATADVSVNGKNVKVSFWSRTFAGLQSFLSKFKSIFASSPNLSIAKAVNQSRNLTKKNIDAVFEEAGVTQYVRLPANRIYNQESLLNVSCIFWPGPFLNQKLSAVEGFRNQYFLEKQFERQLHS